MSSSGYSSHWQRQSLPPNRSRNVPVFPLSSRRLVHAVPEYSAPDRRIHDGLAEECLKTLQVPFSNELMDEDPKITDCQLIGSYNWTKRPHATIIVPGKKSSIFHYWPMRILRYVQALPLNGLIEPFPTTSNLTWVSIMSTRIVIECLQLICCP